MNGDFFKLSPVPVLTRLTNPYLLDLALKNGAVAALFKGSTSGDILDKTILKALSSVHISRKKVDATAVPLGADHSPRV